MIIFGWGKVIKSLYGQVSEQLCSYCNTNGIWQLCIMRTFFTLFFIPIIPYKTVYCIQCPKCGSYMELTKEEFDKIKLSMKNPTSSNSDNMSSVDDSIKYAGKTETQINYLKQMEEYNNNK
jgi:hypothetical protein